MLSALYWSSAAWALYNGFIAYLLIGILMFGEWCFRRFARTQANRLSSSSSAGVPLG
jgi:uncharacterized membrane protein